MSQGVYIRNTNKIYGSTGKHWKMPKEVVERKRREMIGHEVSEETRKKISSGHKGKPTWNKGKHLSEEWKNKLRLAQSGDKSYWFGKHRSTETKNKYDFFVLGKNKLGIILVPDSLIEIFHKHGFDDNQKEDLRWRARKGWRAELK